MLRRIVTTAAIIIVCFLLQNSVFEMLSIASITPNLLIVCAASYGFMRGSKEGMFVGFFCGLLMDVLSGSIVGLYALIYMLVGYGNGFFKQIFFPDDVKLPLILIASSDLIKNLIIYIVLFFFRQRFAFGYYLLHIILPELVYTIVVSIVLYFILLKINEWLEVTEKEESA